MSDDGQKDLFEGLLDSPLTADRPMPAAYAAPSVIPIDPLAALASEVLGDRPSKIAPDAPYIKGDDQVMGGLPSTTAEVLQFRRRFTPQYHPSGAAKGISMVHYTHDAMIDIIIMDPCVSQNMLAAHFGYSAAWISQVIASDAFQARLMERTKELVDPTIRATVEERFKGIVIRSLAILAEKLEKPTHQIPDNLVLRSLELSSRALGYGARDMNPPAQVNVEVHLESLGDNLTKLLHRRRASALPPIEGDFSDDSEGT